MSTLGHSGLPLTVQFSLHTREPLHGKYCSWYGHDVHTCITVIFLHSLPHCIVVHVLDSIRLQIHRLMKYSKPEFGELAAGEWGRKRAMDAESSEWVILVYNTHSHRPSMIGIRPHQVVHTVHTCRPNPRRFFFVLVLLCFCFCLQLYSSQRIEACSF